jgi:Tat protein translocase TatB subunit
VFDLGFQELIVIFIVALLVFGPKRLPELARTIGKGVGELKRAMLDIKSEVNKEIYDVHEPLTGPEKPEDTQEDKKQESEAKQ